MGFSSVVVATRAVVVTVKVPSGHPPRLLDQEAMERQVAATAHGDSNMSRDGVNCPTAVEAKKGNTFKCSVIGRDVAYVKVEVVDDQGNLSMDKI
ncbi:DUF4333 domain-containing protein [Streptomyces sp. NPDC056061]|uniref:DUF4333 domain-containing protein n=1 Tax=Streptomyces sp. NPDC056061 TaxID=3345700 RepID=UPI0035E20FF2